MCFEADPQGLAMAARPVCSRCQVTPSLTARPAHCVWCLTAECMDMVAGGWLELALIIIHACAARQSSAGPCKDAGAIAVRLVGTAVLRGCRRAPRPRHGRRLRVDLIAHSELADRPGPAGHRRGRRAVCICSGGPLH